MPSRFISFVAIIAFAAAPLVTAQTPAPSGTPVASPSPAKHRGHKKVAPEASATPSAATASTTPAPSGSGLVWVNTATHVYHREGSRFYGKTKQGKYVSEQDAIKEGDRAAAKGE